MLSKERIAILKRKLVPEKKNLEELYRKKKMYAAANNFENYIAEIHKELSEMYTKEKEEEVYSMESKENKENR